MQDQFFNRFSEKHHAPQTGAKIPDEAASVRVHVNAFVLTTLRAGGSPSMNRSPEDFAEPSNNEAIAPRYLIRI